VLVAPGTSCREQVWHFTGVRGLHPAELLRASIGAASEERERDGGTLEHVR